MGRRSRKRGESTRAERDAARRERAASPAARPPPRPGRPTSGERPAAPWGNFPLSELVILLGIVLILWGGARGVHHGDGRRARPRPREGLGARGARGGRLRRYVLRDARALQAPLRGPRVPMNERRMRITGIHHITLLVSDVERSLAFYRN